MKTTEKEFNATTGETTITEREMTAEELAEFNAEITAEAARQEAEAQKAADKTALLTKLGISEQEAKLLLS
jgi:FMN-dependent NADH-azoreductase